MTNQNPTAIDIPNNIDLSQIGTMSPITQTNPLQSIILIVSIVWSLGICIHWFNPIVWLSAKYFNEDMELSCDEKVMEIWAYDIRKDYVIIKQEMAEDHKTPRTS